MQALSPDVNKTYKGKVIGIAECISEFLATKKSPPIKMYCHAISLLIEGFDEPTSCQMCSEQDYVSEFEINDDIQVTVTQFSGGRANPYTIKFMGKYTPKSGSHSSMESPMEIDPLTRIVSGTIADCALRASVALYANYKPVKGEKVDVVNLAINTAIVFQDYFKRNL